MTVVVFAKHLPYENGHLGEVTRDMDVMGAPTLRVMRFNGKLYALEGSHRLAAADHLGLVPKLVIDIVDTAVLPDDHWELVSESLPQYDFEHAMILDLNEFV